MRIADFELLLILGKWGDRGMGSSYLPDLSAQRRFAPGNNQG
jgi:hypothetical protein